MANWWFAVPLFSACSAAPETAASSDSEANDTNDTSAGDGLLAGEPDAPAWSALPDTEIPDATTFEERRPFLVASDRLVLFLSESATVGEVNALAAELDATLIGAESDIGRLVLQIGQGRDLDTDVVWARSQPGVETSTWSALAPPQALPVAHAVSDLTGNNEWEWHTAEGGSAWGLKFVRAPQVWNLRGALEENAEALPMVVVADGPFAIHEDALYVSDFSTRGELSGDSGAAYHGNASLGLITTQWDSAGLESVFPTELGKTELLGDAIRFDPEVHTFDQALQRFGERLFVAALDERNAILNFSHGSYPVQCASDGDGTYTCTQTLEVDALDVADSLGADWAVWAERMDEHRTDRWLMTCSAGNTYVTANDAAEPQFSGLTEAAYTPRINSGCANAAVRDLNDHFIVVEALSPGGGPWDEPNPSGSARGATIAAPGDGLGVLAGDFSEYTTGTGTSFASPMVASALAVLWALDPAASGAEIRSAVLAGAQPPFNGSAARLDAWGAVLALDAAQDLKLAGWLADVDDGTVDGAQRVNIATSVVTSGTAPTGDGCVDMRDLRAFRDRMWDRVGAPYDVLDGGAGHPLRDGNGDGQVRHVDVGTAPPAEAQWSRFDFNGDGTVSSDDVRVVEEAWLTCRDPQDEPVDEGVDLEQVDGRVRSADLWIPMTEPTQIAVPGEGSWWAIPSVHPERFVGEYYLVTVPLDACLPTEVRVGNEVWVATDLPYAADLRWEVDSRTGDPLSTPLAYHRSGNGLMEMAVHSGLGGAYTSADPLSYYTSAAPHGDRVVGAAYGGVEVVALVEPDADYIPISGFNGEEMYPWAWNPDGTGVVVRPLSAEGFGYVDVVEGTGWEVAASLYVNGDMAVGRDGIWFISGTDLYRQEARPPAPEVDVEQLLEWSLGSSSPTCSDGAGSTPEFMYALGAIFDTSEANMVSMVPSPLSYDGRFVLVKPRTDGGTLQLALLDLATGEAVVLLDAWEPSAGEASGFEFYPADGVGWLPSGQGVVYVAPDGVHRLTWEVEGLPEPQELVDQLVSDRVGPVVVSPGGAHFLVMEYSGPFSAYEGHIYISAIDGSSEVGPFIDRIERGLPSWAGDGQHVVFAEGTSSVANVVVVDTSGNEVFDTRSWTYLGNTTVERYPSWAVDVRGW